MPNIFITKYPPREPRLTPNQNTPSQLEQLTEIHGVYIINNAPATWATLTDPPTFENAKNGNSLYLWIITDTPPTVYCIKEHEERALTEERNRACHTNLTGGQPACAGGEMWFSSPNTIYLNGCSGRYPRWRPVPRPRGGTNDAFGQTPPKTRHRTRAFLLSAQG